MTQNHFIPLPNRAIITVSGIDAASFLQGLISNDITKAASDNAIYAALLSAQGKFLYDLFLCKSGEDFLIDCEKNRADDFIKKISLYKLRSKVEIRNTSENYAVFSILGADPFLLPPGKAIHPQNAIIYRDPRLADMGYRIILPAHNDPEKFLMDFSLTYAEFPIYDHARAQLGLPDGSRDLEIDRGILLENGFDELHAIDWDKGCYLGQELTARTRYRGLVRKRLIPCTLEQDHADLPAFGTTIQLLSPNGETMDAGESRSVATLAGQKPIIMGLIRLEALNKALSKQGRLMLQNQPLYPHIPAWMILPKESE